MKLSSHKLADKKKEAVKFSKNLGFLRLSMHATIQHRYAISYAINFCAMIPIRFLSIHQQPISLSSDQRNSRLKILSLVSDMCSSTKETNSCPSNFGVKQSWSISRSQEIKIAGRTFNDCKTEIKALFTLLEFLLSTLSTTLNTPKDICSKY
jgi:hypothetical protein